jgi:hypothetical protein
MEIAPNIFAYVALLSWPLVALMLYTFRPIAQATIWTILGAFLLLPVGVNIKFEMIPQFDKDSIPNICVLVGYISLFRGQKRLRSGFGFVELLIGIYLVSPFITSSLNNDPIAIGETILPGVGSYDGFSASLSQLIFFLPFLIGRRVLRSAASNEEILRALVISGLFYSFPMLFEMRMSPQLHNWIYGFYPSEFLQSMREGGFRPMVFTGHGLLAAFYIMTTVVAGTALWRVRVRLLSLPTAGLTIYLSGILFLCKSAGALIYGLALAPLVHVASARLQLRVAVLLVTLAVTFPLLRAADLFPTALLVNTATEFSSERASSLQFRFDQEQALLTRANERFWFGWGRYGRSRVFDEYGNDRTTTDGHWIITLGQFGFVGFLAEFLLLTLPVFWAAFALPYVISSKEGLLLAALSLIVAIGVINQLPNASVSPWMLLVTGALFGRTEVLLASSHRSRSDKSTKLVSARIGQ